MQPSSLLLGDAFLLKGNHEEAGIAEAYGTYHDFVNDAYGDDQGIPLFHFYCEVMSELPVIAVSANGIVGVHGGIPNQDIDSLKILNAKEGEALVRQMIWNDPDSRISERWHNPRGGFTRIFGSEAFESFMKIVPAILMVRSHECPYAGVALFFQNRLATIFSNGSEKSLSSFYKHRIKRPVFLKVRLDERKEKFLDSDFIEVLY